MKQRHPFDIYQDQYEAVHGVTHDRTTEFTHAEQDALNSQTFLKRQPGHFLLGRAGREGELATHLQPITVPAVHAGEYSNRRRIDRIRAELMERDGLDVGSITRQIRRRLDSLLLYPSYRDEDRYARRRLHRLAEAGLLLRLRALPVPSSARRRTFSPWPGRATPCWTGSGCRRPTTFVRPRSRRRRRTSRSCSTHWQSLTH